MDRRKSSIHEHQDAVDALDLSKERLTGELGTLLAARKNWKIEELTELYKASKEIEKEVEKLEEKRAAISGSLEKQRVLKKQIEELEDQEKQFKVKRRELVETLGAHAYRVFQAGILEKEKFDGIFSKIDKIDEEMRKAENELQDLEVARQTQNVLKKVSGGTRIALRKAGIGRLEKKRDGELPKIGEALAGSDIAEDIPDEQVQSVINALKHLEEEHSEGLERKESLGDELLRLGELLEEMTEGRPAEKELKRLETETADKRQALGLKNRELGKAYLLQPSLEDKVSEEVETVLHRIAELEEEKKLHQDQINMLQALLEIDELQEGVKKKEEQIARLEKRIAEDRALVEKTRDELAADHERIRELRNVTSGPAAPGNESPVGKEEKAPPSKEAPSAPSTRKSAGRNTGRDDEKSAGKGAEKD
jgi:uncharacterized phage infection (PIP) family protein YhgE